MDQSLVERSARAGPSTMAAVPLQAPSRSAERVPEAAHLACDVVIDAFGHDSGLVAKFLLRRGNRTLRELTRDTVRYAVRPRLTARRASPRSRLDPP